MFFTLFFLLLNFVFQSANAQSVDPFWDRLNTRDKTPSRYDEIKSRVGECKYLSETAVRVVRTPTCGPTGSTKICHVVASCTRSEIQGSCFVEEGCPSDPIDCVAKQDIVIIKSGADAIVSSKVGIEVPRRKEVVR